MSICDEACDGYGINGARSEAVLRDGRELVPWVGLGRARFHGIKSDPIE